MIKTYRRVLSLLSREMESKTSYLSTASYCFTSSIIKKKIVVLHLKDHNKQNAMLTEQFLYLPNFSLGQNYISVLMPWNLLGCLHQCHSHDKCDQMLRTGLPTLMLMLSMKGGGGCLSVILILLAQTWLLLQLPLLFMESQLVLINLSHRYKLPGISTTVTALICLGELEGTLHGLSG